MRPAPGEWDDLRLAAQAADRGNAGKELWPAFEKRLKELGYGPRAIAHAFSALTGPGTVTEALAKLAYYQRLERIRPVPVEFEIVEHDPGLPVGYSLKITGVERDDHGIRIRYTIRPPLSPQAGQPGSRAARRETIATTSIPISAVGSVSRSIETAAPASSRCLFHNNTLRCCVCG